MNKKIFKLSFVFLLVFVFGSFLSPVLADDIVSEPVMIHLSVQTLDSVIYDQEIAVIPCDSEGDGVMKATPYCALEQAEVPSDWAGLWINSINGIENDFSSEPMKSWTWIVNLDFSNFHLSAKEYELQADDQILFYYEINPLKISDINLTPIVGSELTFSLTEPDYGPWPPIWTPAIDGQIIIGSDTFDLDSNGEYKINITNADSFTVKGQKTGYIESPSITITPTITDQEDEEEEEETPPPSGGGGGGGTTTPSFGVTNALAYLKSVQATDGSFGGSAMYADWAAVAFGAMNETSSSRDKILSYLASNNTISSLLTDNERRAMALLALGQNPYSFHGINYIEAIMESFDGAQFDDINLVNDDIFALIPLSAAGYTASDEIITKAIAFIISKQNTNGSWVESVDITAAAIQALKPFTSVSGVPDSLSRASDYLQGKQGTDGGWGGVSSTSWAMQAMSALSASWTNNGKSGLDYLAVQQVNANNNGSVLSSGASLQNNIWETSYAIPAGLSKPWSAILQSVSKPISLNDLNDSLNDAENNEPEAIAEAEPVFCPLGDLFSATTGEACTAIITPTVLPITSAPLPIALQSTSNLSASTSTQVTSEVSQAGELAELEATDSEEEISEDSLTASATSALPAQAIPPAIPIALGTASGLVLLYVAFKFFFV